MPKNSLKQKYYEQLKKFYFLPAFKSRAISKLSLKRLTDTPDDWCCPIQENITHRVNRVVAHHSLGELHRVTDFVLWRKTGKHLPFDDVANSQWYAEVLYVFDRSVFDSIYQKPKNKETSDVHLKGTLAPDVKAGTIYTGNILTAHQQHQLKDGVVKRKQQAESALNKLIIEGKVLIQQRSDYIVAQKFFDRLQSKVKHYLSIVNTLGQSYINVRNTSKEIIRYNLLHIRAIVDTIEADESWKQIPILIRDEITRIHTHANKIKTYQDYLIRRGFPVGPESINQVYYRIQQKIHIKDADFIKLPEDFQETQSAFDFSDLSEILLKIPGIKNPITRCNVLASVYSLISTPGVTRHLIQQGVRQIMMKVYPGDKYSPMVHTNLQSMLKNVYLKDAIAKMIGTFYTIPYKQLRSIDFGFHEYMHEQLYRMNKGSYSDISFGSEDLIRFVTESLIGFHIDSRNKVIHKQYAEAIKTTGGESKLYILAEWLTCYKVLVSLETIFSSFAKLGITHFKEYFVFLEQEQRNALNRNMWLDFVKRALIQLLKNISELLLTPAVEKRITSTSIAGLNDLTSLISVLTTHFVSNQPSRAIQIALQMAFDVIDRKAHTNRHWHTALESLDIFKGFNYHVIDFRPSPAIVDDILKVNRSKFETEYWRLYVRVLCGLVVLRETVDPLSEDYVRVSVLITTLRRLVLNERTVALINIASLFVDHFLTTGTFAEIKHIFDAFDVMIPDDVPFELIQSQQSFNNEADKENFLYCKRRLTTQQFEVSHLLAAQLIMCFAAFNSEQQTYLANLYHADSKNYARQVQQLVKSEPFINNMIIVT